MPSTKRSVDRARVSNSGGAGGEPLGETPATPSGILDQMSDEIRRKLRDEVVDEFRPSDAFGSVAASVPSCRI